MYPINLTYGFNADAEAEETQWAKGLPDRKEAKRTKPERTPEKSNLDYADDCYFAGLKDKTE